MCLPKDLHTSVPDEGYGFVYTFAMLHLCWVQLNGQYKRMKKNNVALR
jgi:hypothetical protein